MRHEYVSRLLLPEAIDWGAFAAHHSTVALAKISLKDRHPIVVGCVGGTLDLQRLNFNHVQASCDIVEIRLDLLDSSSVDAVSWRHLLGMPLLFTARRGEEGGAGALSATAREDSLRRSLGQASFVDIEVASMTEMRGLMPELAAENIPWIASYHDFERLPPLATLKQAAAKAKDAGAAVFKLAARLATPADVAALAEFQLADHGIPVATMGMGPLAPVSRLLCAQCGSVLNYGYLGDAPTAPGQWDSALMKLAISRLVMVES